MPGVWPSQQEHRNLDGGRSHAFMLLVVVALLTASGCGAQRSSAQSPGHHPTPDPHVVEIVTDYTAWDGVQREVRVLLPASYDRKNSTPLPVVISPHGREEACDYTADHWGDLPAKYGFAVLCPAGEGIYQGKRVPDFSYASPGQVSDLMSMPDYVEAKIPWLRFDRSRVYAAGDSMGGLESLALLARYPDRLAAVVAMDGVADLTSRYNEWAHDPHPYRGNASELSDALGGTPQQIPFEYEIRSPLRFARTIAFSEVPLQIWWSRTDIIVIDQGTHQSGLLYRTLRSINPAAPVSQVVTETAHGEVFDSSTGLPAVVDFFRPNGQWRRVRSQPPDTWVYQSWLDGCEVWRHSFSAPGVGQAIWEYDNTGTRQTADSPVRLCVGMPANESITSLAASSPGVRLTMTGGRSTLCFPSGRSWARVP